MTDSAAMAMVAVRARSGAGFGEPAHEPAGGGEGLAAVAIAMAISGMTGIAASSAIRPVRQGCGCSSRSHQMPTRGPVSEVQAMVRRA